MQSIMENFPNFLIKRNFCRSCRVVMLAAAGWQFYSSIMHKPQEANYIPSSGQ